MLLFFQLLCTLYFAALTWTLYLVRSNPAAVNRTRLFWMGAATMLVVGVHLLLKAPLGNTTAQDIAVPKDKFWMLLQFDALLALQQVVYPWWRRTFVSQHPYHALPAAGAEKLLAANDFIVNKALYVLLWVYQTLALWVPQIL